MPTQSFTRNCRDHSNNQGYQFEFFCDKCGNGHRSSFQTSAVGFAASMLKAAGAFLGGGVQQAGWGADHLKDALRGPAWDDAFKKAIDECKPKIRQCTLCGRWVCPEVCWNHARGLCEACAPDLGEHAVAVQAQVAVDQVGEQARAADQVRGLDVQQQVLSAATSCPKCQGTLAPGAKFCAQCGTPIAGPAVAKFCSTCGGALQPGARFCSGCGANVQS